MRFAVWHGVSVSVVCQDQAQFGVLIFVTLSKISFKMILHRESEP